MVTERPQRGRFHWPLTIDHWPSILALVAILSASASAQTFRTTSNIVAVDASVYDKNGQPVTNLTAADFQIFEDGKPQPIQTIYLVTPMTGVAGSASATGLPGTGAPEHPLTSAPVRQESRNRVLIFVFDLNHLSADGYKRSRAAVESFLKDGALGTDMVGVVAGTTMLTNKISAEKAPILDAMKSMKGPNLSRFNELRSFPKLIDDAEALAVARGNRETTDRVVQRACSEEPDSCSGRGGDEVIRQQIEAKARQFTIESQRDSMLTISTLGTLTSGLGRFPGTKQVLLLSDGFFTGELENALRSVVELAARNNVRFSTLDSRGLGKDPRMQNMMGAQPLNGPGDMSPLSFDENADALASLAIDTGGEMVQNRNDLKPGIDVIARTSGTYYVLGFATSKPMDGSYRSISVRVTQPGLTVRARKGYVANAKPAEAAPAPAEAPKPPSGNVPAATPPTVNAAIPNPTIPDPTVINPTLINEPPAAVTPRPNATRNVDSLTKIAPSSGASAVEKLADAGWAAYSKGDVATAQKNLSASVKAGPAAPWVFYALGFSEYALGRYEPALAAWENVRSRVPEFMPVYFDVADAYISLGRNTDALAVLRVSAKRWPDQPEPQNALGALLVRRGALDEAIDVFAKITAAQPADSLGFFNLGRAYHLRYLRLQQNVAAARLRDANAIGEDDRKKALAAYKQYLALGGPYEKEARTAITQLDWSK
jgi:VWFA-related protein